LWRTYRDWGQRLGRLGSRTSRLGTTRPSQPCRCERAWPIALPEGGGVDIVEARLDVSKEGGDPEYVPFKGQDLVDEGEASVEGTETREGAPLVRVQETSGATDCRQSDHHDPFQDSSKCSEED